MRIFCRPSRSVSLVSVMRLRRIGLLLAVEVEAEARGARADDDARQLARGELAPHQPVEQEAGGRERIGRHVLHVRCIVGPAHLVVAVQALGVLVADERLGEIDRRQRAGAVRRIGYARMMQAHHDIAGAVHFLRIRCQSQAAAAVDAFLGDLVAVPDVGERRVEHECAVGAGDVAHVGAADEIGAVADAGCVIATRGEQQPRHLETAGGQHEARRLRRRRRGPRSS